jgi:hypothetical protein
MWISFLGFFHAFYEINREFFFTELFEVHESHEHVSYTLAECLFDVAASRLELAKIIQGLLDKGLIASALPRDEVGPLVEESEPPPFPTKRTRHSLAGGRFDLANLLQCPKRF